MFFVARRSGGLSAVVATSLLIAVTACGPSRTAYFQPQVNAYDRSFSATAPVPIIPVDSLPAPDAAVTDTAVASSRTTNPSTIPGSALVGRPGLHRNPDSQSKRQIRRLLDVLPIDHVPLRSAQIDRHSPGRKTHRLGLVALGLSALSYAPLLLGGGSVLAWALGLTLPLAAVLLGVASLTTIHRNKDRYRGKGWAMAAIVIATGAMGLALVAVAALSVSKVVWEK